MIKNNFFFIFLCVFLSSCATSYSDKHPKGEFSGGVGDDLEIMMYPEIAIRRYINAESPKKFLVKTKIPVRTVLDLPRHKEWTRTRRGDVYITRYYESYNQKSFLYGFLEAYNYCKIDNPINYKEICLPHMIGDFEVNAFEKEYLEFVVSDDYFDIVIKDFIAWDGVVISDPLFHSLTPRSCEINKLIIKPGIEFNYFYHYGCETRIRPKLKLPEQPVPNKLI